MTTYVVLLGVLAFGGLLLSRALLARRDHRYAGLIPGQLPAAGDGSAVEAARAERAIDVEVRCVPPAGISPGEAGVLLRRRTSPADVRATLIDLAARGYVRVEETVDDRTLTVGRPADADLLPHERALLASLFPNTDTVRLSTSERLLTQVTEDVEDALARSAVERGWYRRMSAGRFPVAMVVFVVVFSPVLAIPVVRVLAPALEVAGIDDDRTVGTLLLLSVPAVAAMFLRGRTGRLPAGYAAHHQVLGFKCYLETAGPAVLERYLPWAVAFGLTAARRSIPRGRLTRDAWHPRWLRCRRSPEAPPGSSSGCAQPPRTAPCAARLTGDPLE
ncbi:DUF2207 domain-containing protein [Flindersiella endophytica]